MQTRSFLNGLSKYYFRSGNLYTFVYSLLPKDLTFQNLFTFTAAGVVPCDPCKSLSYIIIVQNIFACHLGFILSYFENIVPLKPVPGGVASVARFITRHEQTQLKLLCWFHFFCVFLAS